ncbi:MAG: aminoacyl-tRNA hydrolase [Clostridia bacterium]|nr:aminoacyl-tRNA hydrolase [Clostridia bacterium]
MKLIVGLGNPGSRYEATRHNVGFLVIDRLARELGVTVNKNQNQAMVGQGRFGPDKVLLVKPQTYMNKSGEAVGSLAGYYKVEPEDVIVIYDDLDLEPGRLRIRAKGSAGGHNGIKSIISHLGTEEFPRIKVGIGRPVPGMNSADYVLGFINKEDWPVLDQALNSAMDAVKEIIQHGIIQAMNLYNRKNEDQ